MHQKVQQSIFLATMNLLLFMLRIKRNGSQTLYQEQTNKMKYSKYPDNAPKRVMETKQFIGTKPLQ